MAEGGVIPVVSGFGNMRAVGGGKAIAVVTIGTVARAVMDPARGQNRHLVIGGHCHVRTIAVAITNAFRPSGATAVSMV